MWKTRKMHFFSGTATAKIDDKGRFVLPCQYRNGLVEEGELQFYVGIGLGGCLNIYKKSQIEKIVRRFQQKQHLSKYQAFFTAFFSTLQKTTCDKLGRVMLPSFLKSAVNIDKQIVIAGVLGKIEIWPQETYDKNIKDLLQGGGLAKMTEEAFALLGDEEEEKEGEMRRVSEQDLSFIDG